MFWRGRGSWVFLERMGWNGWLGKCFLKSDIYGVIKIGMYSFVKNGEKDMVGGDDNRWGGFFGG